MPCLSLMHRKIYRITVAKRIAARRLASATQKKAQKSAQKAAKKAARAQKIAQKSLAQQQRLQARAAAQAAARAEKQAQAEKRAQAKAQTKTQTKSQAPAAPPASIAAPAPSSASAQPTALSTLQSKLIAVAENPSPEIAPTPDPAFRTISAVLQEFEEGIVVRVPHTRVASILEQNVAAPAPAAQPVSIAASTPVFTTPIAALAPTPSTSAATTQAPWRPSFFHRRPTRAELINAESSFGRTLFGPIPAGHRREFFHDRDNVWIWYESWTGVDRQAHQLTVRYEVRPTGVYKKLAAGNYATLEGSELENFRQAAHAYLYLIKRNLYHLA